MPKLELGKVRLFLSEKKLGCLVWVTDEKIKESVFCWCDSIADQIAESLNIPDGELLENLPSDTELDEEIFKEILRLEKWCRMQFQ